ncbi:MAG: acyltransferase [Gammaproteobacteria bacterium]|nr:acyltransferase [Gammaproteobacteria bacterium]
MLTESDELIANGLIGQTAGRIPVTTREENREIILHYIQQARQSLEVFTYNLDKSLFDQHPLLEAIKTLALSSPKNTIRILLQDNHEIQQQGHRLIELTRRLTSQIEIRRPHIDYIGRIDNFLVVDRCAYLHRSNHRRYDGEADFNNRLQARQYSDHFMEIWECSEPDSALRRLYL